MLGRTLYDEQVGLWCVLVAIVMPILAAGSVLMTIDSLSVLFWAMGMLFFWRALQRVASDWILLGLSIEPVLAKFTNGVQLACIGLLLLSSPGAPQTAFQPQDGADAGGVWVMLPSHTLVEHPNRLDSCRGLALAERSQILVWHTPNGVVALLWGNNSEWYRRYSWRAW